MQHAVQYGVGTQIFRLDGGRSVSRNSLSDRNAIGIGQGSCFPTSPFHAQSYRLVMEGHRPMLRSEVETRELILRWLMLLQLLPLHAYLDP